jgi:hypothetical protein
LASIKKSRQKTSYEIIVVDNSSTRLSLRGLKYIKSQRNVGYGAGNNLGASVAKGKYLFILNPDTKVLPGTIDVLVNFLEKNKKAAMVAPNLLDKKGKVFPQLGSRTLTPLRGIVALSFLNKLFPNNRISKEYWLKDMPMDKLREVDAVPGSAFMIRRDVFEKVGRFDENFFLFFEESDLGKRVKDAGYKIFITPKAEVIHYWDRKKKSQKVNKAFEKSRFYYFKKHYGFFSALAVEIFAKFSKQHAFLLAIIILGLFLRFYRIEENLVFHGELGHNYLAIKNFIQAKKIPLLGPPTSHPWLSFGPLFYWLFAPVLALAGYNPVAGAYFMALVGVLVIIVNYLVVEKLFNKNVALYSSFLIAISPTWIAITRQARFFSLVTLFFYPFWYFLVKKKFFWLGFFFGLMLNFHLSPIILLPATILFLFQKRKRIKRTDIAKGFLGLLIPNLPFLLYNLKTNFGMFSKLILWFPYRVVGFFGLYPKNNISFGVLKANLVSFYKFMISSFIPVPSTNILMVLFFIFFIVFILLKRKTFSLLFWFLIFGYLGIFIHGDPPSHYYLPLLPLPILFFSFLLEEIRQRMGNVLTYMILIVLVVINFQFFFSVKWFYRPQNKIVGKLVPYKLQLKIVRDIITDARGRKFSLKRIGSFDYFEGDYAQNYQYLLWWLGNEPVEDAALIYTIYENDNTVSYYSN